MKSPTTSISPSLLRTSELNATSNVLRTSCLPDSLDGEFQKYFYNEPMTVCIAALADKGKSIVLGADNMLTIQVGTSIQYQVEDTNHKKIQKLNNYTFALCAGMTSITDSILKLAKPKITVNMHPVKVAEHVKEAQINYHRIQMEDSILKPNGLDDWNAWISKQKNLNDQVIKVIQDKLNNHLSAVKESIIIAGFETDQGPYIGTVAGLTLWDRTSECLISNGSGGELGKFSMLLSDYKISLSADEVKIMVKKALEDAKKSPGVGDIGDLFIFPEE